MDTGLLCPQRISIIKKNKYLNIAHNHVLGQRAGLCFPRQYITRAGNLVNYKALADARNCNKGRTDKIITKIHIYEMENGQKFQSQI